jgi:hypothetical protein
MASSHFFASLNTKFVIAVIWICHKQQAAEARKKKAMEDIAILRGKINPFVPVQSQSNVTQTRDTINNPTFYSMEFFMSQWADQVEFQKSHTEEETKQKERLATYFQREKQRWSATLN